MKSLLIFWGGLLCFLAASAEAALLQRQPNTTLALPVNAPQFGYRTEPAFGSVQASSPLAVATPPGETNRLFIVEQAGRILVVTNLAAPSSTVFMDIRSRVRSGGEQGMLGLAFHPGYATNGYFFVFYCSPASGSPNRLSRFQRSASSPNQGDAATETILISQADEASNHNGGDLHFGRDGYLYVSLGDEGGGNDSFNNSQRIDKDFFAGILRIDVDKRPGNLEPNPHPAVFRANGAGPANYSIPADNPFVGAATFNGRSLNPSQVRSEFWATGLRNPWRMSFDRQTGTLYCGDVGQNAREEINIITKGGNYGWNIREGTIAGPNRNVPPGFTSINPLHEYGRNLGVAVTGGVVYRGHRFSQLYGAYIFADNSSGNIWSLRHQGGTNVVVARLAGDSGISAFGIDPSNGDVLLCDLSSGGSIKRLVYDTTPSGAPIPPTLDATGAFQSLATLEPHPGIVPYEVNLPFWSDNAHKKRWFSIPGLEPVFGFNPTNNWSFPTGAVFIKHFSLEMTNGVPESARRIETRFIVRSSNGVYGVTYRWDGEQANATLVPEEGMNETFMISDGGAMRPQVWRYPSRVDCLSCHTSAGGLVLGFNTAQLNRSMNYGGEEANQLSALSEAGYLDQPAADPSALPALASADSTSATLENKVRSYLAANCVQCHQPGGTAPGLFDARYSAASAGAAGLANGRLNNPGSTPENRVIKPGLPELSVLLQRISRRGAGQMPPLASNLVDSNAVELVSAWIDALGRETFAQWQATYFASAAAPQSAPEADPDQDGMDNHHEYLAGRNPLFNGDAWGMTLQQTEGAARFVYPRVAHRKLELFFTTDIAQPSSWQAVPEPVMEERFSSSHDMLILSEPENLSGPRFYRVRVSLP